MTTLNRILLTPYQNGRQIEGVIDGTPKPGTCMTIKAEVEPDSGGRLTWEAYNRDANSNRALFAVLLENFRGGDPSAAYVSGERGRLYFPLNGDELLMLVANIEGTGDAFTIGQYLIIENGTGKLLATASSPEIEPFVVMETKAALTADTLVHVSYTNY